MSRTETCHAAGVFAPPPPARGRRVVILVENLPVPADRRVWQEARALRDAGFDVTVICPKGKGCRTSREITDGILIHRHWLPEAHGKWGYAFEYAAALLLQSLLAWRVFLAGGFDIIQACNPPDLLFLVALQFRPFGVRFVFDHHDLAADLFAVKFPASPLLKRAMRFLERATLRLAHAVICTNEMFVEHDLPISGKTSGDFSIVLSSPDPGSALLAAPEPSLRAGRAFVALYVGVMGSQDGVGILLDAAAHLVHGRGRDDIQFVLAGDGPERAALERQAADLGIGGHVTFLGFVTGETLWRAFRTADVGLCPDPPNPFNDRLTMNKLLEYMAFGVPCLGFDLAMSRRLVGEAGLFVEDATAAAFGDRLAALMDDADQRRARGAEGRRRFTAEYAWPRQVVSLLGVYERVLADGAAAAEARA